MLFQKVEGEVHPLGGGLGLECDISLQRQPGPVVLPFIPLISALDPHTRPHLLPFLLYFSTTHTTFCLPVCLYHMYYDSEYLSNIFNGLVHCYVNYSQIGSG